MIPIQAAIGGKIIARETIKKLKDVLTKFMVGATDRKRKLLEKQKKEKQDQQFGR